MSRFVRPETRVLTLANGDTLIVKKRLNRGEQAAAFARMYAASADGAMRVNPLQAGMATVVAYLIDWHLADDDVPIRGKSAEELESILNNLSTEDFAEIRQAIEKHETEMAEARDQEKKLQAGKTGSAPTSPSPSEPASVSTASAI